MRRTNVSEENCSTTADKLRSLLGCELAPETLEACLLADRITRAFELATRDAVERMHAAGVATVGVDENRRIRWTLPDGSQTYEDPNGQ
jgi:predicted amino acid dehydrogenase